MSGSPLIPDRPAPTRDPRPACLVTNVVSPYRIGPFRILAQEEEVEVIAYADGGPEVEGLPVHRTTQAGAVRRAGSGRYRAVVCGLGGRLALPGSYAAARLRRVPFVLWATIWAHPRSAAHALSYLPTRHLYRHADAVATYGPHVSRYVAARRGGRGAIFEAPQAVSTEHFGADVAPERLAAARERAGARGEDFLALFVGRLVPDKGLDVLLEAWRAADLGEDAALAVAGEGPLEALVHRAGPRVRALGQVSREELPALYAAADALVLPSVRTATFLEPWGLVINEAMLQSTPIIASASVGAAAGGLVRQGHNGLVTPERNSRRLAEALSTLYADPAGRRRLGVAARTDALAYSERAWAEGMSRALASVGSSRS
ncbi:MAG: glycosyltransferase family 4 protein [Thermoleophilaceae bacterium]